VLKTTDLSSLEEAFSKKLFAEPAFACKLQTITDNMAAISA
jgi:hypothetical protein